MSALDNKNNNSNLQTTIAQKRQSKMLEFEFEKTVVDTLEDKEIQFSFRPKRQVYVPVPTCNQRRLSLPLTTCAISTSTSSWQREQVKKSFLQDVHKASSCRHLYGTSIQRKNNHNMTALERKRRQQEREEGSVLASARATERAANTFQTKDAPMVGRLSLLVKESSEDGQRRSSLRPQRESILGALLEKDAQQLQKRASIVTVSTTASTSFNTSFNDSNVPENSETSEDGILEEPSESVGSDWWVTEEDVTVEIKGVLEDPTEATVLEEDEEEEKELSSSEEEESQTEDSENNKCGSYGLPFQIDPQALKQQQLREVFQKRNALAKQKSQAEKKERNIEANKTQKLFEVQEEEDSTQAETSIEADTVEENPKDATWAAFSEQVDQCIEEFGTVEEENSEEDAAKEETCIEEVGTVEENPTSDSDWADFEVAISIEEVGAVEEENPKDSDWAATEEQVDQCIGELGIVEEVGTVEETPKDSKWAAFEQHLDHCMQDAIANVADGDASPFMSLVSLGTSGKRSKRHSMPALSMKTKSSKHASKKEGEGKKKKKKGSSRRHSVAVDGNPLTTSTSEFQEPQSKRSSTKKKNRRASAAHLLSSFIVKENLQQSSHTSLNFDPVKDGVSNMDESSVLTLADEADAHTRRSSVAPSLSSFIQEQNLQHSSHSQLHFDPTKEEDSGSFNIIDESSVLACVVACDGVDDDDDKMCRRSSAPEFATTTVAALTQRRSSCPEEVLREWFNNRLAASATVALEKIKISVQDSDQVAQTGNSSPKTNKTLGKKHPSWPSSASLSRGAEQSQSDSPKASPRRRSSMPASPTADASNIIFYDWALAAKKKRKEEELVVKMSKADVSTTKKAEPEVEDDPSFAPMVEEAKLFRVTTTLREESMV